MEGKGQNPPMLDGRIAKYFEKAHIPTSKSVPLDTVMDSQYCFLPKDKMVEIFKQAGLKDP
jgi:3-mercaptopyruvate sulfurtransferase SseA